MGSDEDGKSHVAKLYAETERARRNVFVRFLCTYTVARRGERSPQWKGEHPSKNRLAVKKLSEEKRRIPQVIFLEIVDPRFFREKTSSTVHYQK